MADGSKRRGGLYCGPDLINAAKRSNLDLSGRDRFAGILNAVHILADSVRYRQQPDSDSQIELVLATGLIPGTSTPTSIAYTGRGDNRDWCIAATVSEPKDFKRERFPSLNEAIDALTNIIDEVDIIFVDNPGEDLVGRLPADFVRIPAWIKQRVRLADNWASQIRSLKRGTRQEIGRILRKYRYECRLTREAAETSRFYDQQYRPYIRALYGEAAIVVDRDRFIRECQRGVLLQLIRHDDVVATALLRPIGRTMAVVWTGMESGAATNRVPGATDALDYFSLLYAHLRGCQWLDFGPSRADLCDGTLRYKSKWGSEITAGHFTQPTIYWTCNRRSPAVKQFLQQHAFVSIIGGQLTALFFWDNHSDTEMLSSELEKLLAPGISECRVISLSPLPKAALTDLKNTHSKITIVEASSVAEAIKLAS